MLVSRRSVAAGIVCLGALVGFSVGGCPGTNTGTSSGSGLNLPPVVKIDADTVRGSAPLTVKFSSDGSTDDGVIVSRSWDFGDGTTSDEINPTHKFTTTGDFDVKLTLTDDGGSTAARTRRITVSEAPIAKISVDRDSAETAPAVISFSADGSSDPDGTITGYEWNFGDNVRERLANIAHQYTQAGTYRATLTVTDNAGVSTTAEVLIRIGITKPTIEIRTPPSNVTNVAVSVDSPLWLQAVITSPAGVPRFVRAGLDSDRDQCEAQAASFSTSANSVSRRFTGHADKVNDIALLPDGSALLTASDDKTLRLYNTTTGALIYAITETSAVNAAAFSIDGTRIVYGTADGRVVLRQRSDGAFVRNFASHTNSVSDVRFSPDGTRVLSGAVDRRAILWNVSDGTILRDLVHPLAVTSVAFDPADPALIATGCVDNNARIWNVTSGAAIATFSGHTAGVNGVLFSKDGATLYTSSDDKTARAWTVATAALTTTFSGNTSSVLGLALSSDETILFTGASDGSLRQWTIADGKPKSTLQPCASPIPTIELASDGKTGYVAIAARNDIQLDTNPPSGNDIDLSVPRALRLSNVPPGQYYLWVEVATDQTDPVRTYAFPVISVVSSFTTTGGVGTPVVPLVNNKASVVVAETAGRQVFDIGPVDSGDRIEISLLTTPGFSRVYTSTNDYSVAVLDGNLDIIAWYQKLSGLLANFQLTSREIAFNQNSRVYFVRGGQNQYVVVDGGTAVDINIVRGGTVPRRTQRVLLDFNGGTAGVGDQPAVVIPALNARDINNAWGAADTIAMKTAIRNRLNFFFSGYNITFSTTDDATLPDLPYATLLVGGTNANSMGMTDFFDIGDPQNDTVTGRAVVYAITIGRAALNGDYSSTPTDAAGVGTILGTVAAHQLGHLLGLRHTDDGTDLMGRDITFPDPTTPRSIKSAPVSTFEQLGGLPSIGNQDADQLIRDALGG